MNFVKLLPLVCALATASLPSFAQERVDHYKGERADTLEQAVSNFQEYNDKLAQLVGKDSLTPKDMNEIHQLTYTLENALQKIQQDLEGLAETLENVHVASETADTDTVKTQGAQYLETARQVVQ